MMSVERMEDGSLFGSCYDVLFVVGHHSIAKIRIIEQSYEKLLTFHIKL